MRQELLTLTTISLSVETLKMRLFGKTTSAVLVYFFCGLAISKQDQQFVYIRGIRCNFSEEIFFPNYSCFAKSHSRSISTGNLVVFLKNPQNSIKASSLNNFSFFIQKAVCTCLDSLSSSSSTSTE